MSVAEEEDEFRFEQKEFRYIADLVKNQTGIVLADHKKNMVYSRLVRRLRALGLRNFEGYCALLEGNRASDEMGNFINAITTNLTRFFREPHHFEHLSQKMKEQFENSPAGTRIRIWSAGCSSGEEPYTIAMAVSATLDKLAKHDFRILATDLDTSMVSHAARGHYEARDIEGIPDALRRRWVSQSADGGFAVKAGLQQHITFKKLNLLHKWPMKGKFDAIFCRNVMIYFDNPTKDELLRRFHDYLAPGGWLYIGHAETILEQRDRFIPMGKTIYQRAGS